MAIEESASELGQVLLIGGQDEDDEMSSAVHLVDLATGVCTAQSRLVSSQGYLGGCSAARLLDGRIVCVGGDFAHAASYHTAQVLEPPAQGSESEASWQWRYLPDMSVGRFGGRGCVLSDGRFAVFGGLDVDTALPSSCEALTLDVDGERWDALPPMHEGRCAFACAAVGGCVIVAGGFGSMAAEVYEKGLGRWRRLPRSLPFDTKLFCAGSALLRLFT